jgi:hypothetical protein
MTTTKLYKSTGQQNLSDLPPQAAAIIEEVRTTGVIKRDELLAKLEARFRPKYTQSSKHVFSFYRGRLISEGFMIEITV